MNNLWEGVLGALAVAAISGLAFIAYKHPSGYKRLSKAINWSVLVVWLIWLTHRSAYIFGFQEASRQVTSLNLGASLKYPEMPGIAAWVLTVPFATLVLTFLLELLPLFLQEDKGNNQPRTPTEPKPPDQND
jgi:hypothetical protein